MEQVHLQCYSYSLQTTSRTVMAKIELVAYDSGGNVVMNDEVTLESNLTERGVKLWIIKERPGYLYYNLTYHYQSGEYSHRKLLRR